MSTATTLLQIATPAVPALIGGWFVYRQSTKVARISAESQQRQASQTADVDRAKVQQEALDKLIQRLTGEIERTQTQVGQLREQLTQEQEISDGFRRRIRELEDQIHQMGLTIADLRKQRIADDAANMRGSLGESAKGA